MNDLKWRFLDDVYLTNAMSDALRRSCTYSDDAKDSDKEQCRNELKSALSEIARRYQHVVDEQQHIDNIHGLKTRISQRCKTTLRGGTLRFGVAQKAVNVYLKYLWCAGAIPIPPHCTFDDTIIGKLKLPSNCSTTWTMTDSQQDYDQWVSAAKVLAGAEPLAAWELRVWS